MGITKLVLALGHSMMLKRMILIYTTRPFRVVLTARLRTTARTQTLRSEPRPSKMQDLQDREGRPSTRHFHDGHPVLPGFVLSDKPVAEDTWFVPLCQQRLTRLNVSSCQGSKFPIFLRLEA